MKACILAIGAVGGAVGTLAWSQNAMAACQELRADAFEATWAAKQAMDECTCAVTGKCRR